MFSKYLRMLNNLQQHCLLNKNTQSLRQMHFRNKLVHFKIPRHYFTPKKGPRLFYNDP